MKLERFLAELRRRRVVRLLFLYLAGGWALIEVADTVLPRLGVPDGAVTGVILAVVLGLPLALTLAWMFDLDPDGIVRTEAADAAGQAPAAAGGGDPSPGGWRIGRGSLGLAFLLLLGAAGLRFAGERPREQSPWGEGGDPSRPPTVAVLPCRNLSAEAENAFFSAGIHEEIILQLTRISGIRVIPRTSVMAFEESREGLREALGADVMLECSVRRSEGRVRIGGTLFDAASDNTLWADQYDRELADIFSIQTDVAQAVARALRATLTPNEVRTLESRPTTNLAAYDHYLSGLALLRGGFAEDVFRDAARELERAVDLDPGFALAWAQLSRVHGLSHWMGYDRSSGTKALARQAAEEALSLDPELPEARLAMGEWIYRERDYVRALAYLEPALRDRPGDPELMYRISTVYRRQGRWEESLALMQEASRLDPLNVQILVDLAHVYMVMRQYDQAMERVDRVRSLVPTAPSIYSHTVSMALRRGDLAGARRALASAPEELQPHLLDYRFYLDAAEDRLAEGLEFVQGLPPGDTKQVTLWAPRALFEADYLRLLGRGPEARERYEEARARLEALAAERTDDPWFWASLARAHAGLGRGAAARAAADRAGELLPPGRDANFGHELARQRAYALLMLGDRDGALRLLEEVEEQRPISAEVLRNDPGLAGLRGE